MGKTKEFEVIECECGNLCPIEYSYSDEDGSWTCGQCMVSDLSHQIHARKGQKEQDSTGALHKHDVTVLQGTFCTLYRKECMGNLCSAITHPEKCDHLKQNAR